MKINSLAKLGGVALVTGLILAGCGSKSSQGTKKQEVSWMTPSAISTMDTSKMIDLYSAQVANGTNEGLLRMAKDNKVDPGVAKSYNVSKDGKTWTFNLRHSKWNDGTPVTAKDFVYAWQRTVKPKTASQYAYIFANIKNAAKINAGKMSPSKLGVKADGDYKFVVTLDQPQSYFKFMVTQPEFFPQNSKTVAKYGSDYGTNSTKNSYNGPFILKGWSGTNDTWKLVKNSKYWDAKKVKLDQVNFQAVKTPSTSLNSFNSGKLDFTTLSGTLAANNKNNKDYVVFPQASTTYMEFNTKKIPALRNVNIRKAMGLAIDKKQMVNKVMQGGDITPKGFVPASMAKHNGKDFADQAYVKAGTDYNLKEAKALFAKGLKQVGKKSLSLTLMGADDDDTKRATEFVQSQLTKLPGLKITNSNIPFKSKLTKMENQQFDIGLSAWIADYPDPSNFLDLMTSNNSYNDGKWSNKQYDALIKKSESTDANNETARWNDMVQAEKILMNQQGLVPLYQQGQAALLKGSVKGVQAFTTSPQYDWSKAYVK
ncbi:peptide ABC transporter substrate-binding protein [Lentilactobacillus buchneri]|uniref:Periplasmic oligopeptide-binding protein n=1 Tax=Lentilactobacillus buchneri subsp. silagei CD034 TaxID=1071400 RepID=J9W7R9_LENBU|nr:peptide ABC transporter substrate-binding protein [Lentilactobacillus buchneri]MCC6101055.1 peptide ABC transporter substrate-binding protein [Lactobacillus sp.]AFS00900.1 periplasmic oligopeptide-binding protein [Lentilactobacillus buchneri subsp. silagei CD034]MCT2899963.1 peptide ABC transporter substrate-binding protein [Lentilactobacillus buchneri]MCT3542371.1 peptide ABC transporter substrate-binding protein [Lentilactobacillus buchneri]MCT3545486.1 peptide ABC transporter substrate-b